MIMYVLIGCAFLVTAAVGIKLRRVLTLFRGELPELNRTNIDALPSVSLCIPARNEMHAMTTCLENALLSNYPKLEIIVLDDGSRDTTGHLIKSFAHSGIRFVEGSPLPSAWLGKNHALEDLLRESSGSLVIFADVDTQFSVDSISQLVAYMQKTNADMVSVLPFRLNVMRSSAVFATFRHFWNIVSHTKAKPAVASNAWMIKRSVISEKFNGFKSVAQNVRPEREVAQQLSLEGTYRFIISNNVLGMSYEKKLSSQYETSIRIYYPDFGLGGIALRIFLLIIALTPYLFVVYGISTLDYLLVVVSFIVTLFISFINAWYLGVVKSNNYGVTSLCLPFIMLREIYLLAASFVLYKTGRVTWKGRPVSLK
ncbi:glycosyltransferase family 2 protein [Candidatus Saccharibacteria bacterium]|nr:glycosyltransferase family 2 protein [Candidatus Saccharibacteria bacterium]